MIPLLDVDKEYELVLADLKQMVKSETDPEKVELLKESINKINRYLNYTRKKMSKEEKNEFIKKQEPEIEIIYKFLKSKMFNDCKFSHFRIWNKNEKKLKKTTISFIKKSKFQLLKRFRNVKITQLNIKRRQAGTSIYIDSIDKTYVFISKNNALAKANTLIHELGHAKIYDIKKKSSTGIYFEEVYPKFLELIFSDYLIDNGLEKHGYNIKISLLNEIKMHITTIKEYNNDKQMFYAPFNYHAIKDNILAICIYLMYKKKPNDTIDKLNIFMDGLGKMNEEELLNIFDLNSSIFMDKNTPNDFFQILTEQKEEIKRK